ncbi:MAG: hypothetical protein IMW89_17480 [Ktedonobacteraceae bacterium]|nr:hypothetical protein [Ktedonobacteraceae bacterium]
MTSAHFDARNGLPPAVERAERRMQQKWYDVVTAEQQGASPQVLERMYNAYMLAVEEYNHCCAAYQSEDQEQDAPVSADTTPHTGRHRKKAS